MTESSNIETAIERAEQASHGRRPDAAAQRRLRTALGRFATGVTIVTTRESDGAPVGMTVNSFASVSLEPPLVLWSAARSSLRYAHFAEAEAFAIYVLADDQKTLAERFARQGHGFDGLGYSLNERGVPVLDHALARFECDTEARHDGGDHTIIIGRVTRFESVEQGAPLVFAHGSYGRFASGLD